MFLTVILQLSFTVVFMKVSARSWITPLVKDFSISQHLSDIRLSRSTIAPVFSDYNVASDQSGMTAYTAPFLRRLQLVTIDLFKWSILQHEVTPF